MCIPTGVKMIQETGVLYMPMRKRFRQRKDPESFSGLPYSVALCDAAASLLICMMRKFFIDVSIWLSFIGFVGCVRSKACIPVFSSTLTMFLPFSPIFPASSYKSQIILTFASNFSGSSSRLLVSQYWVRCGFKSDSF